MKPVVVLVEPENPRNIGFVARAMYCNEWFDLRIVDPSRTKMHEDAYITGVAGKDILTNAKFFTTLAEATAECVEVIGFSRRTFSNEPCKLELPGLPAELPASGEAAFVFGRESQGLFAEELSFCSKLCAIPIRATTSYNLGQAAAITLYEIAGKSQYSEDDIGQEETKPVAREKELVWNYLREHSAAKHFQKGEREIQLRAMVEKMNLTQDELHFLLGLLTSLNK